MKTRTTTVSPDRLVVFSSPPGGKIDPKGALKNSLTLSKGSLVTSDGLTISALPPGPDGDVLTTDSTQTLGIKWAPGGGGGGGTVVTFQPGGTPSDNVFTDFGLLCTHIATVGKSTDRWTIQLDGSQVLPVPGTVHIPTGTYPMPLSVAFVSLSNPLNPGYPTLNGDSVVFSPAPSEIYFINIPFIQFNNVPETPVMTADASDSVLHAYLVNTEMFGATPVFAATNGAFVSIKMFGFSTFGLGGSTNMLTIDATSGAAITAFDAGDTSNGSLAVPDGVVTITPGGAFEILTTDSARIGPGYLTLPGTTVILLSGIQSGTATLTNGVTTLPVVAIVSATSRITLTHAAINASTALGTLVAGNRIVGSPGSFTIRAANPAAPALTITGDQSSIDWHIIDTGN